MEDNKELLREKFSEIHVKEAEVAARIAKGFEDMAIGSQLDFVFQTLGRLVDPDDSVLLGKIPMELQVAFEVLCQVRKTVDKCPSIATLIDQYAEEFEQGRPRRPVMISPGAAGSDGPPT